jgi:D-sedoheptulose 7-phosphate isomerase
MKPAAWRKNENSPSEKRFSTGSNFDADPMTHSEQYLKQTAAIALALDIPAIERVAHGLAELRDRGGRLFLLGVGGSAANCSHAVNDFRKLAGIEAYSPCDNVAELTARTNDEGWETVFEAWLRISRANANDAVFILSVGGGDIVRGVSANLVRALDVAKKQGTKIYGIVGRDGGHTKKLADEVIIVPTVAAENVTPHTESFQAVIWHCLVCHPALMLKKNKWEGLDKPSAPLTALQ